MASSTPDERTGQEQAGSTAYFKKHYIHTLVDKGWSFSGFERDVVFLNRGDGTYLDVSGISGADSVTDGRGVAFADFDNDGDTDIFVHTIQGPRHLLFRNDAATGGYLRVDLRGKAPNTDAIGAVVTVTADSRKVAKQVSGGSGFLSDHDRRLLYGLGAAKLATVDIRWPDGTRQTLADVPAGNLRVTEGDATRVHPNYRPVRFTDPVAPADVDAPLVGVGDRFPSLPLTDLNGAAVTLAGYRQGRPLLANFWATWCKPCQHEMPELERLSKKFAACLPVVGVSVDIDQADKVKEFLGRKGITYPVVVTDEEGPLQVFREDRVLLPTSFLIDRDDVIRGVYVGGTDAVLQELERDLTAICAKP